MNPLNLIRKALSPFSPLPPQRVLPSSVSLDALRGRLGEYGSRLDDEERSEYGLQPCRGKKRRVVKPDVVVSAIHEVGCRGNNVEGLMLAIAASNGWNESCHACEVGRWAREVLPHGKLSQHALANDACTWGRWGIIGVSWIDAHPWFDGNVDPREALATTLSCINTAWQLLRSWGGVTEETAARLVTGKPRSSMSEQEFQHEWVPVLASWREWQIRYESRVVAKL